MRDENKNETLDQQKRADEKAQLSEETLNNVSGGLIFVEEPIEYHSKGRVQ